MDHINRFESRVTYTLLRAEFGVAAGVCTVLFLLHWHEIRWIPAIVLFSYIDLIGYIPGLIAYLRSPNGRVPRVYYVLYNTMHSFITQAVVVGVWVLVYGWEWALLIVPIHLCGDRSLFGNFMKTFQVSFEPKPLPAWVDFQRRLSTQSTAGDQPLQRI